MDPKIRPVLRKVSALAVLSSLDLQPKMISEAISELHPTVLHSPADGAALALLVTFRDFLAQACIMDSYFDEWLK